jgi:hypothetical protein
LEIWTGSEVLLAHPNIDHVKVQPLTLEQLLDFWKKYAVEDD